MNIAWVQSDFLKDVHNLNHNCEGLDDKYLVLDTKYIMESVGGTIRKWETVHCPGSICTARLSMDGCQNV